MSDTLWREFVVVVESAVAANVTLKDRNGIKAQFDSAISAGNVQAALAAIENLKLLVERTKSSSQAQHAPVEK